MPLNADSRDDAALLGPEAVPGDGGDGGDGGGSAPTSTFSRVTQACVACRRKKVKCDGNSPCSNCSTREQACEYPGTRDNASVSRRYAASFEARVQQMDALCQRLEDLEARLAHSLESIHQAGCTNEDHDAGAAELLQTARAARSTPALLRMSTQEAEVWPDTSAPGDADDYSGGSNNDEDDGDGGGGEADVGRVVSSSKDVGVNNHDLSSGDKEARRPETSRIGALVRDSYGRLRFVGGAANHMLIEAVKSLSPGVPVSASSTPNNNAVPPPSQGAIADLQFPLFIHGSVWPELPYLPKPEQLSRPPKYVADLLVNLYFDQLHNTFPILFKPHFMRKYGQMLRPGPDASSASDRRFLMVFFAVCACASGLLPSSSTERRFAGIEHYEKALLLCYAANGEASLERVQCLALLAMCAAGWNTLTQSWMLAGQAVRAAQDIGLHLSCPLNSAQPGGPESGGLSDVRREQIARRVWWSIYSLDRVVSICLGRPMATSDEDCDCDLPLDMSDEQLESYGQRPNPSGPSAITGFIAFSRLCRIAGKIQQLHSPKRLRELASVHSDERHKFLAQVVAYDKSLTTWVESLPDEIRFSANALNSGPGGSVNLTMCVIIFIVHAGSLLNLYRYSAGHLNNTALPPDDEAKRVNAVSQCISAAKSCINAAELVRDLVPPSHHLAFCVYYLTLSGVVLLRMPTPHGDADIATDVEKCVQLLADLEPLWSGASRGRAIVAQLFAEHRSRSAMTAAAEQSNTSTGLAVQEFGHGTKRTFAEYQGERDEDTLLWQQIVGSEMFNFDFDLSEMHTI